MRERRVKFAVAAAAVAVAVTGFEVAVEASRATTPKFAALSGENEVDGGDPDGRGSATFIIEDGQLCFGLAVANISKPTGAHIHANARNHNGPVIVPLTAPDNGDPGASSACVPIREDVAATIRARPNAFYVNVHTADFPGGAVRGQVFLRHP